MIETDLIEWVKCPKCVQRYPRAAFLNEPICYRCQVVDADLVTIAAIEYVETLDRHASAGTLSLSVISRAYQPLKKAVVIALQYRKKKP